MSFSLFDHLRDAGHVVEDRGCGRIATLSAAFRRGHLTCPSGTVFQWDGAVFPSRAYATALAGTRADGTVVEEGTAIELDVSGRYWSVTLGDDAVVAGLRVLRGSRVEWLFCIDTFDCMAHPRPFQIDLVAPVLHEDAFDIVQVEAKGVIRAMRAAHDVTRGDIVVRRGRWLFLGERPFVDDRGADPAMRYYDGSGGRDV